ncbi:MAG TPA: deoxyribose-phosphate aldolase [Polyangia bacterium]|jgi:deoxyribose-phosphate aldolase
MDSRSARHYRGQVPVDRALALLIDHTCLRPEAIAPEIDRLCAEARTYGFRTVCVQPTFVAQAARALVGSGIGVAAVVGFPHGANSTETKLFEARRALDDGATELDVVANLGWIRAGDAARLTDETERFVRAATVPVKVILETALFSDEQKTLAARAVLAGGPAFLKTSTGFGPGGATVADVALLKRLAGSAAKVKASGGIRTRAQALMFRAAGADRLGASASVELVSETDPPG